MNEFAIRNLHVLAYAGGLTHWVYIAKAGTLADVAATGFFNGASDIFAAGDRIMVSASDGGMDLHVVASSDTGGVVVKRLASTEGVS